MKISHLDNYSALLDDLFVERTEHGKLSDETEESFAVALADCRNRMTEEEKIEANKMIARKKKEIK